MAARSPFTGGVGASKDYLLTVLFWKFPVKFSEGEHHLPAPSCAAPCILCVPAHEGWGVAMLLVSFITADSDR